MSNLRAKVVVRSSIPAYKGKIGRGVDRALVRQGGRALAAIRELAPVGDGASGVLPGHMRDTFRLTPVRNFRGRREVSIMSSDPTALWQDQGTLGRRARRAKTSRAEIRRKFLRQTKAGRAVGVKAKRFFRKGLLSVGAAPGIVEAMRAELGRLSR